MTNVVILIKDHFLCGSLLAFIKSKTGGLKPSSDGADTVSLISILS